MLAEHPSDEEEYQRDCKPTPDSHLQLLRKGSPEERIDVGHGKRESVDQPTDTNEEPAVTHRTLGHHEEANVERNEASNVEDGEEPRTNMVLVDGFVPQLHQPSLDTLPLPHDDGNN